MSWQLAITLAVGGWWEGWEQTTPQHFVFLICRQALFSLTDASLMTWQRVRLAMYLGPFGECLFSFLSAEVEWCGVTAVDVLCISWTLSCTGKLKCIYIK